MKHVKIVSVGVAMLICLVSFATAKTLTPPKKAEKTITGTVTDADGPLPGASVTLKGTTQNTVTDFDGKYSILATEGQVLVFEFIGMQKKEVTVGKSSVINVRLINSSQQLQDVVVTEYENKGRVSNNKTSKKERVLLRGKSRENAAPSAAAQRSQAVVIRGNRSLTQENEALVVIDGKEATQEQLRNLPNDRIDAVSVVKGAQASALYGSKGANGLIAVKTKGSNYQLPQQDGQYPQPDDEDYDSFIENPFTSPKNEPLSTFSIDVDNASYTNVRRFLNNGQKVPKNAVRIEEMVNFFKYAYPQPKGNDPFSINTEVSDCPWNPENKLVRIGLQGKEIPSGNLPASNLVFLIDVSGSMNSQNKLPLLKESMKVLVNQLREEDKVSIVVYAGAAGLVLPPTSGSDKTNILTALQNLSAGGSTAGGAGIELAYKTASEHFIKGGNNRVILATDGDFNVGASSNTDMETLIEQKRKTGVFLTVLGYGMGNYKDSKMEILADKGNGNYAYIDNIQEANRFLGKEFKGSMFAIAKDVKIQIEFNPKHVQSYRLIGYENRKLRPEDFTNDAIDAGELGSGHTVTALYEIIPQGVKSAFFKESTDLKYTETKNVSAKYSDELATVKFRYKKPDGEKSIEMVHVIPNQSEVLNASSADMKFSAAVAWFGLKLRDSKLIAKSSSDEIKKLAKEGLSNDPDGYKAEFIRLVESAQTIGYAQN